MGYAIAIATPCHAARQTLFDGKSDVSPDGKYTVRLYNQGKAPGDGFWQDVTIDSLIPCALRVASRRALRRGCDAAALCGRARTGPL